MLSSLVFLQRLRKPSLCNLLSAHFLVRWMGGGPRTFPGGLNKWQWKRLHEKKAREKEKRLLDQEKQLYQARLRSQIRAELTGGQSQRNTSSPSLLDYSPMSPEEHIKTLADRFVKAGAEDLWNEKDGHIRSQAVTRNNRWKPINSPTDLRKLRAMDGRNSDDETKLISTWSSTDFSGNLKQRRYYSVSTRGGGRVGLNRRRMGSTSSDDDEDYGSLRTRLDVRWPKFNVDESRADEEGQKGEMAGRDLKRFMSSAALGKHDVRVTRRRLLHQLEQEAEESDERDLSGRVEEIRKEVHDRRLAQSSLVEEKEPDESIFSEKRFEDFAISPLTVKALSSSGYLHMTKVQEATLSACLEGKDALVKAKAGTGKSAAFLILAVEEAVKAMVSDKVQRMPAIYALILCPTRELASQIAAETRVLVKYHQGLSVLTLIGGTRFKNDLKLLESSPCQIIVATPGRLLDHIEHRSTFSVRLMGLKLLVLDEADHLLDLGFRKDVERIIDCLPRQKQSLLFSATIPREVRRISQLVLKRDHTHINTVGAGYPETHCKVKQFYLVAPHEQHFQMTYELIREHLTQTPDYKVIVFNTTGMVTSLMYLLFREMQLNVREIHSRKPQLYRSRISDEFRQSKRMILISSDVSARGMNYPEVTLVIQVGIPSDREQYIHRLGRTGREGKDGTGILLLAPWEEYFLDDLTNLPIERASLPRVNPDTLLKMDETLKQIDTSVKEAAYHAWLGYYNSIREIGRNKTDLVDLANQFCQSIRLEKPPSLFRKTALKMGLKDISGIRIRK